VGKSELRTVSGAGILAQGQPSCFGRRLGRRPTWMELRRLEPRLFALLKEAKATDGSDRAHRGLAGG